MLAALVTCAEVADLDADDRLVIPALAVRDVEAEPAVWDDVDVHWSRYDLAVLRSTWDYPRRRQQFLAWAESIRALANPADVVRWNTDKRYLAELADLGLPVVPTTCLVPGEAWTQPRSGRYVIKPSVGVGGLDSERYDLSDDGGRRRGSAHVERLHAAGRDVMIQPYLSAVDQEGETALLYIGGEYSHAIRKGPMLAEEDPGGHVLYRPEEITPRRATAAERAVAEQVLAAVPGGPERLLYARVDLVPGPAGSPVLLELELTEPSLYLGHGDGAPERFAEAIVSWLRCRSAGGHRQRPRSGDEETGKQLDEN
jgi:hypothetical protein